MKNLASFALAIAATLPAFGNMPAYRDTSKPVEERVEDALARMTLQENIQIINAKSKFCSPGVPRLGIP